MGSMAIIGVFFSMFIFGVLLYLGSFLYAYFFSRSGRGILFRDYYECGFKAISDNKQAIHIHFLAIGLFFLVYEMELILFVPLVLNIHNFSFIMLFFLIIFIFLLGISFWYEWDKYMLEITFF